MSMPSPDLRMGAARGGTRISFLFDGEPVMAYEGETVAMALWAAGIRALRTSPVRAEPRGVFCGMGACQECVVSIDGRRRESCMTIVRDGLHVHSIHRTPPTI